MVFISLFTFSISGLSANRLENLSNQNFTSFNGEDYDQFSSFEGTGLRALIDTSRIFTITLSNATTARTGANIYLVPGLDYGMGKTSVNGVLYDSGTINDSAGNALTGLTVTSQPKTLYWLYSYLNDNPTLLNMIKIYSSSSSAQCSTSLVYKEQSPFQDLPSTIIPLAQNQTEMATRSTIAQVNLLPYGIVACMQSQLALPLYMSTSDTTTVELYFAKTINNAAVLKQQVVGSLQAYPQLAMNQTLSKMVSPQQVSTLPITTKALK